MTDARRVAGKVTNPEGTERLHEYWVHGEGAAKIRWGAPGDFDRCVLELGKYIRDPQGYCNLAHHAALGIYPATHAAEIKHAGRADMAGATRAQMSTADINNLPDSDFALIKPGGTKDSSGRTVPRDLRFLPIHDAAHVRDALSRLPQSDLSDADKAKAKAKIAAAANRLGVDADGDTDSESAARAAWRDWSRGRSPSKTSVS